MTNEQLAKSIADAVLNDVIGRSGWGDQWDCFDAGVKAEIKREWCDVILSKLNAAAKKAK